tara:strand:+ start:2582 stop:3109 length:528 start_codon:yes stop_codon:yes gene_type:complete
MKHSSFILALPRSRTSWLTAFLQQPDAFCGHDLFSTSVDASVFYSVPHKYGISVDTNPIRAREYEKDLGAPLIIIKRDAGDVLKSLCKAFGEDKREYLSQCTAKAEKALKEAELYADLIIPFEKLDESLNLIWDLCYPDKELTMLHKETFKGLVIDTKQINYKDFKEEFDLWLWQ